MDRKATVYDLADMVWWNGMTEAAPSWWAGRDGTGGVADDSHRLTMGFQRHAITARMAPLIGTPQPPHDDL